MLQHGLTCEHPKKDLANGDRLVEPVHQGFFFNFVSGLGTSKGRLSEIRLEIRQESQFFKKSHLVLATFFELIV
jgi:hypothetical protein